MVVLINHNKVARAYCVTVFGGVSVVANGGSLSVLL